MEISLNWLNELLPEILDESEMLRILTDIGLEVEGLRTVAIGPSVSEGVVVGFVESCEKHPNADRLNITKVNVGSEQLLDIVCGAPNIASGLKVLVATVGTQIGGKDGFKIKKAKIRGQVSQGMICSETELGIGIQSDGIKILDSSFSIGTPLEELFPSYKDKIIEIGLTPNRGDASSHWGVARDLLAAWRVQKEKNIGKLQFPQKLELPKSSSSDWSINIENQQACRRYAGICIEGLQVGPSPKWLRDRLSALGINSINNVVDVTNWVMNELGQPLHAFDASCFPDKYISVGHVNDDTAFTALDGKEIKLLHSDLMILSEDRKPLCIAGVYGSKASETKEGTERIFLESAYFDPKYVRKSSMYHNLRTQAATIYEKGADPNMVITALERATFLILQLAGGRIASRLLDCYPEPIENIELTLRYKKLDQVFGAAFDRETLTVCLNALDIIEIQKTEEHILLEIPAYRSDVTREIDVIEEVIRIYGMDNIPIPPYLKSSIDHQRGSQRYLYRRKLALMLCGQGFNEMLNLSLTKEEYFPDNHNLLKINNTSNATLNVMRPNLLHPALERVAHNINRQQKDLKFFEFGRSYQLDNGNHVEEERLLLMMTGKRYAHNWLLKDQLMSTFDVSGLGAAILKAEGIQHEILKHHSSDSLLEQGFSFVNNDILIGYGGKVAQNALQSHGIDQDVYIISFSLDEIINIVEHQKLIYKEISKYPTMERHLAIKIKDDIKYTDIQRLIINNAQGLVSETELFDVYRDSEMIQLGEKSYAISILFSKAQATLTDKEVDGIMTKVIKELESNFSAIIRK